LLKQIAQNLGPGDLSAAMKPENDIDCGYGLPSPADALISVIASHELLAGAIQIENSLIGSQLRVRGSPVESRHRDDQ
jgi:hypothetical protein